jgi:ribosomal protein S18 acetylase RimI-like enzyme
LSTDPFERAGFSAIDRLALLETPLGEQHCIRTTTRTRPLRSRHMDDAAAIDRRAFGPPWGNDRAALADILRATPSCRIRSVAVGRAMSGFAITGVAGRTGYLQRLAVDPGAQRRGLGRALVADSLVWMRRRGARHAMVNTAFDNVAAISLYESFGFRQRDDSLVILELRLDPRAG